MKPAAEPSYLEPLNPEQRQAVLHTGKPLLILAGAGSGKTRVITTKIAWLIREKGMDPRSILAVTFTNKAAREMAQRARQIEERAEEAMLRTFHSFGAWFLRRNGNLAGLNSGFVIYDDDDVISLLSTIMENAPKPEVKKCAYNISRAKDYFLCPESPELAVIDGRKKFRDIYARYEERMSQIGNVDFGDLIKKPVEILRCQPETARRFHERFSVIMVDEYQDANVAQFQLLKELCGADTYVCVVGDDDQSIYRFRGAEVKNILEFPDRFSDADIIRLERNYRSTSPILKAASSVVDCNHGRLGKTLRAEKGDGPLPVLAYLRNQDDEAAFCADNILNSVQKKQAAWSDWAILYRTNAQSLGFETTFLRRGIPYRVVGSLKFYEREEIKDALALLSFLVNPRDEVAFRRVVNKPARGIGAVSVEKIAEAAIVNGIDLIEAGKDQEAGNRELDISKKARKGLDEFYKLIEGARTVLTTAEIPHTGEPKVYGTEKRRKIRKEKKEERIGSLKSSEGLSVCIEHLINESGLAEYHKEQDETAGNSKINNLQELLNGASEYSNNYEGLLKFLEDVELDRTMYENVNNQNDQNNSVTLITFHNTKGLEFKRVIMTGLEHGIFPREDKKDEELEEERRLFYVGATRAMDELYMTTCEERRMYGRTMPAQPSLFLREVDRNFLRVYHESPAGAHRTFGSRREGKKESFNSGYFNVRNSNNGRSVNPFNMENAASSAQVNRELEERAGWKTGQRLFHDDHGYGAVMEVKDSEDGPIVRVRFDSGQEKRFLSEYQGRSYEKIGDDY
ncbi:MAG: ATP-dependent helicase [Treponema sp.]|jgi:DNA helicase-2/ATP-dependent DNA helicase PcrA|nr:ATP-dependent helicase [Treponema sp.]